MVKNSNVRVLNIHVSYATKEVGYSNSLRKICADRNYRYMEFEQLWAHPVSRNVGGQAKLIKLCKKYRPTHTWMQIQKENILGPSVIKKIGINNKISNWTGDVRDALPDWFIQLAKVIYKTGVVSLNDVDILNNHGANGVLFPVGFDPKKFGTDVAPVFGGEIVFMAHRKPGFPLSGFRNKLTKVLIKRYGKKFVRYGRGSKSSVVVGTRECAIYKGCSIALSVNNLCKRAYTSDRFMRILASGAFCISHHYPQSEFIYENRKHAVTFVTIKDLVKEIDYYLEHETERKQIAKQGHDFCWANYSWDVRMAEWCKLMGI